MKSGKCSVADVHGCHLAVLFHFHHTETELDHFGGVVVRSRTNNSEVAGRVTLSKLFTLVVLRPTQPFIPMG